MKKVIASAGLLALGTVGVQTAHAQWAAGSEKPWSISGTLRGFYDDNINTQPNGPGRVSSTGFEVRPSASLNYQSGPTTLNASYTYALLYYTTREPNKIDQDHDFELWMDHNFSERYTLDVRESFVIAQEPDVLAPGSQTLFLRANGSNIRNTGTVNFHAGVTRLFGVVLGYSNTLYDYSEDASDNIAPGSPSYATLLNRIEQAVTLDTTWQIQEQTTGILGYKFDWVNYTGSGSILPPPSVNSVSSTVNNNYSHIFYVGANETFRTDLSASARVGAQYISYYQTLPGNSKNALSPYVDISMTSSLYGRWLTGVRFHEFAQSSRCPRASRQWDHQAYTGSGVSHRVCQCRPKIDAHLTQIDRHTHRSVSKRNLSWWISQRYYR